MIQIPKTIDTLSKNERTRLAELCVQILERNPAETLLIAPESTFFIHQCVSIAMKNETLQDDSRLFQRIRHTTEFD